MASRKLTKRQVETAKPGRMNDGDGLVVITSKAGSTRFVYRFTIDGKTSELGLGSFPKVQLEEARKKAAEARELHKTGLSPIEAKRKAEEVATARGGSAGTPTFGQCAEYFLNTKGPEWRSEKHAAQWRMTLTRYAAPLWDMPVDKIDTDDVLAVLKPVWTKIPETASRLRGRIEIIIDSARARGFVPKNEANPARLKNHLSLLLPKRQKLTRGHHAALKLSEMKAFMRDLRARSATAARALEFLILCACRSNEVLGSKWDEIDWDAEVFVVPAERMKGGVEHIVPLSPRALEILKKMKAEKVSDYIFPGHRAGRPLSNTSMEMLMRRMGYGDVTPHGMRSVFRDWAGDIAHYPRELAEQALAHTIGNKAEAAYRRGTAVEKRREMMAAWASYIEPSHD